MSSQNCIVRFFARRNALNDDLNKVRSYRSTTVQKQRNWARTALQKVNGTAVSWCGYRRKPGQDLAALIPAVTNAYKLKTYTVVCPPF